MIIQIVLSIQLTVIDANNINYYSSTHLNYQIPDFFKSRRRSAIDISHVIAINLHRYPWYTAKTTHGSA